MKKSEKIRNKQNATKVSRIRKNVEYIHLNAYIFNYELKAF